jgi:integrase/recombinase XerC
MPLVSQAPVKAFFDYLKFEKRYSPNTILSYEKDIAEFSMYLEGAFGEIKLASIDHNHIRSWFASLKERKLSSRSINRKISTLRSFYKYCLKRSIVNDSPMVKVHSPKISKRLPQFVKEEDTKRLLSTLNESAEDWNSLNAQLLINLFYSTGMRLSELINLKEKQMDAARRQIKVLGKGNKERIIPVNPQLIDMVKNYVELKKEIGGADYLMVTEKGRKLYPKYAWRIVNEWLGRMTTLDKKSPHVLRHTFATHLMNNGANLNAVKELLGHSSLASTQIYTHNTIGKLRGIHKKSHPKG